MTVLADNESMGKVTNYQHLLYIVHESYRHKEKAMGSSVLQLWTLEIFQKRCTVKP